ncbi:MAG: choice-of-anchor J domain-containing protein [Muribaculaceae bacterium]|nr:choice-of-anchor J domain-containing protein [Muribaculaceae bacterium]
MKQILLPSLLLSAALGMSAASPAADLQTISATDLVTVTNITNHNNSTTKRLAPGVTMTVKHGLKKTNIAASRFSSNKITLPTPAKAAPTKLIDGSGYEMFESFEDWDGTDYTWIPAGWNVDMQGDVTRTYSWTPYKQESSWLPAPSDGSYAYAINFASDHQDEWLITPEIEVQDGMELSYHIYLEPAYLFNLDSDKVDWDTYSFIGDPEVSANLQIMAQPEGGAWEVVYDYFDNYKNYSLMDLFDAATYRFDTKGHSLSKYAGKKVKLAFRLVGADGNLIIIDAVGVGYPKLEGVNYMDPFETLYWGFSRDAKLTALQAGIAMYPVYSPLTWTNAFFDDADITWTYCDPVTADFVTSDNPEELVVTYVPDYSSAASMKNNFFYPPTLSATAPGAAPGSFTAPYTYFQAGGKAERTLTDGTEFTPGLIPFDFNDLLFTFVTTSDDNIGAMGLPVFGYNMHSNQYWLNYSLGGAEANPSDYARLEGIANIFYAPAEAPLVANGLTVHGYGLIGADAELTASIYALDETFTFDYENITPMASATIKGSDVIAEYHDSKGYICLPFDFAEPAILQTSDETPAYIILLTGFNSDKVEYFAPLQNYSTDRNYLSFGFGLYHIDLSSHVERPAYWNLRGLTYIEDGDYVDVYGTFAISIEGEYPWLTTESDGIELGADPVEVALGSYYDGSKLSVEAPAGITAAVAGRYNACKLTVTHSDPSVAVDGNITVKGPGVEVSIPVKASAGIADITTEGATLIGLYDLNGRSISRENAATGIYVAKYSDGTARKITIK